MRANRIETTLTWLGGGESQELGERHERSTHAIVGVTVLLGAALAWLVATLAVAGSTRWPMAAIIPLTFVFGLLVGAVGRAIAGGPARGWPGLIGRAAVAVAVGVVVGELAALVVFSGPIDRRLDEQADAAPAVTQAAANLDRTRDARAALDNAVEEASRHREEALVVARCEYNPSPDCPQTHITGVPGVGPETRTANEFLADSQQELDNALAERDRRAPELDAQIAEAEQTVAQARETVDRGLGARWVAMNDYTLASAGALLLRLLTVGFFVLLSLMPLILKLWRGETTHDRGAAARVERERAELEADTAIAVKRAEVRKQAEIMWAEQQLASVRLAVEAQTEIDREQQRRRVIEALDGPVHARSERPVELVEEDMPQLPAAEEKPDNLPARAKESSPLIPTIPDVTKAAARWIRPFVPPIIANAIDTTTKPLRATRQVFEETEEIDFTLKRTHKVSVRSEESGETTDEPRWIESSTVRSERQPQIELDGPRQLPPSE